MQSLISIYEATVMWIVLISIGVFVFFLAKSIFSDRTNYRWALWSLVPIAVVIALTGLINLFYSDVIIDENEIQDARVQIDTTIPRDVETTRP